MGMAGLKAETATNLQYSLVPLQVATPIVVLATFPLEIGRGMDADVQLSDAHVSRRHCEIMAANGALTVVDLGSKNSTFVNGVRRDNSPLSPGDVLGVGEMRFVLRLKP